MSTSDEIRTALQEYLDGLLRILGESAELQFKEGAANEIYVNLQGLVALDGVDPKPLRSLSYLAEISLRRKLDEGVRIRLDANGGQERRQLELQRMAESAAQRAIAERKSIELDPMETHERKIVHEILSRISGVQTHSEGQGEQRRVVVEPATADSE